MTNTETKLYPILISHKDGSFWATPEASIEAGLLNGMVEAQRWANRTNQGSIFWTEITDRFVKGEFVASRDRIVVMWSELPFAVEEELNEWVSA
jgi:hypothetical protein